MSQSFTAKKQKILEQLSIPEQDYTDLSPKGSVDEDIRELVDDINQLDGFVTTSSCAGRVAAYLEGVSKHAQNGENENERAPGIASGGKGGGQWLFVSHDPLDLHTILSNQSAASLLGLSQSRPISCPTESLGIRFIHLKFEPMVRLIVPLLHHVSHLIESSQILHILTSSLPCALQVLSAALSAGFRESGIASITSDGTVMVAVRTAGLAFDSIIAYMDSADTLVPMVSEEYLQTMFRVANERFVTNGERKERFRRGLLEQMHRKEGGDGRGEDWEPAEQRRERKRAEGLKRRAELAKVRAMADDSAQEQKSSTETLDLPSSDGV